MSLKQSKLYRIITLNAKNKRKIQKIGPSHFPFFVIVHLWKKLPPYKIISSIYCYGNCTGIAKLTPIMCNVCLAFSRNFPPVKITTFSVCLCTVTRPFCLHQNILLCNFDLEPKEIGFSIIFLVSRLYSDWKSRGDIAFGFSICFFTCLPLLKGP